MWRLALLALLVGAVSLAGSGPVSSQVALLNPAAPPSHPIPDRAALRVQAEAPAAVSPDPEAPQPEPLPAAPPRPETPYPGPLKPGDWVQVTGTASCLNVRMQPGLGVPDAPADPSAAILNCLPDGFIGRLSTEAWGEGGPGPFFADGHWWWQMVGQGWLAQDWLASHHEGGFPWPQRLELAGDLLAYLGRDGNLWLMNADGSGQRLLASRSGDSEYFSSLAWSPTGDKLSFTIGAWSQAGGSAVLTRIVDPAGALLAEYPGLAAAVWSPHAGSLSALRVHGSADMMGYLATPVVVDLAGGVERPVGPRAAYNIAPAWSPDGRSLAFTCISVTMPIYASDGSPAGEERLDCQGEGLRLVSPDGSQAHVILPFSAEQGVWYANPSWSPAGDRIAVFSPFESAGCRGYVLLDVQTGSPGSCFPLPPPGGFGGRCGSFEDGASDWSPDGRYLFYHWEFGAGRNGVWMVDTATGQTSLLPTIPAAFVSAAPDGRHLAFSSAGYVWVADTDGSGLALLVQGHEPAWQPRP